MTTRVETPAALAGPRGPAPLRARFGKVLDGEPLLRNGHVLTLSSLLTAALGAAFWVLATSWYDTAEVGRSYAALSAVMLLSGIGQLNLADVLVRFVPASGPHAGRLARCCYLAGAVCTTVVAALFLLLVPVVAPGLGHLRHPATAVCFIAGAAGYSIFVLQDGALTGLRRTGWVLGENALFAAVKAGLLALCGILALGAGILAAWTGALLIALVVTNVFLFRSAVPAHRRAQREAAPPQRLLGYAAADYVGAQFRMAAYNVVPLLVLNRLGPDGSAYFSLAWVIAYTLYMVAYNMGSSLIVEAARAPERLVEQARRVLRHNAVLLAAAVAVLLLAAPWLLALFGPQYSAHGTALLRLLALSALPNLVLSVAVDVARARRRLGWVVLLQAVLCVLVLGLSVLLIPRLGVTGVGVAWLAAECALGLPLLVTLRRWLPVEPRRT
ncbi:lipopolysaccharide biosynthesis protein [Streptacidiphilus cavernicola]|uniref:Lipopolysaccharide biosynthesis protein n=1 Tax=Streptacidiphilus cavernicola TaxID=3342716 RepID=A0ABV6W3J8_9ACTN